MQAVHQGLYLFTCRNYIEAVYSFLDPAEVKLPMLLTTIRFHYGENFQESGFSPSSMSKDATYVTIITEVNILMIRK